MDPVTDWQRVIPVHINACAAIQNARQWWCISKNWADSCYFDTILTTGTIISSNETPPCWNEFR